MKAIIIFSVMAALLAVAGAVMVGIESFDGTVADSPYEEGLKWDETRSRKAELGWGLDIKADKLMVGENTIKVSLSDSDGSPLMGSSISFMISRPATSVYDMRPEAIKLQEGIFKASARFPLYGYWDITAEVTKGADTVLFRERVFVDNG